jgi:hypothetical protein
VKRWRIVGSGAVVAGLLAAGFCLFGIPDAARPIDRICCWAIIMAGPVYVTGSGLKLFYGLMAAGWIGLLLATAHPVRPGPWTAAVSIAGLALWFGTGWLTVVIYIWIT